MDRFSVTSPGTMPAGSGVDTSRLSKRDSLTTGLDQQAGPSKKRLGKRSAVPPDIYVQIGRQLTAQPAGRTNLLALNALRGASRQVRSTLDSAQDVRVVRNAWAEQAERAANNMSEAEDLLKTALFLQKTTALDFANSDNNLNVTQAFIRLREDKQVSSDFMSSIRLRNFTTVVSQKFPSRVADIVTLGALPMRTFVGSMRPASDAIKAYEYYQAMNINVRDGKAFDDTIVTLNGKRLSPVMLGTAMQLDLVSEINRIGLEILGAPDEVKEKFFDIYGTCRTVSEESVRAGVLLPYCHVLLRSGLPKRKCFDLLRKSIRIRQFWNQKQDRSGSTNAKKFVKLLRDTFPERSEDILAMLIKEFRNENYTFNNGPRGFYLDQDDRDDVQKLVVDMICEAPESSEHKLDLVKIHELRILIHLTNKNRRHAESLITLVSRLNMNRDDIFRLVGGEGLADFWHDDADDTYEQIPVNGIMDAASLGHCDVSGAAQVVLATNLPDEVKETILAARRDDVTAIQRLSKRTSMDDMRSYCKAIAESDLPQASKARLLKTDFLVRQIEMVNGYLDGNQT